MQVTTNGTHFHAIEDLIKRFGKEVVVSGVYIGLYKFHVTESRNSLKEKGFSSAGIIGAMKYMRQGRPLEHISKTSGRIKKEFHGYY